MQVWLKCASGKNIRLVLPHTQSMPGEINYATWSRYEVSGSVSFAGGASGWNLFDTEQINAIDFVATTSVNSNGYPMWFGPITVNARSKKGILSLRMDGEYASQSTLIAPLLDEHSIRASLALTHSDIGTAGRMSQAEIAAMYASGHEVVLHTFDSTKVGGYANATDWPSGYLITQDITSAWAAQRANGWTRGIGKIVEGFSGNYFNANTAASRQKVLKAAFLAAGVDCMAQITAGNLMNNSGFPDPGVRIPTVRCPISINSTTTAANVIALIDAAIASGDWAVIVCHQAVADNQTPAGNQMRVGDFATWIAYAASKIASGDLLFLPMGEAYDLIYK